MPSYPSEWTKNVILKNGVKAFLRPGQPDDTEMLWEMFSTLSRESLEYLIHPITKERVEGWTSNIDYSKHLPIRAIVQEDGKARIVGTASLSFHSEESTKHKAELGVTVHDDYQGQGLGTIIIKHLLQIAQEKRLKKIYLRVGTSNHRAIHVYKKCGFTIEAKLEKEDYVDGRFKDDYRMAIFL